MGQLCSLCSLGQTWLIMATFAPLPTASLGGRREKQRAGWSRMASAGQPGSLGTLSDGLLSPSRPVWTGSTGAAGFWERQWKFVRLRTATCHFCHFLLARTSHETRPNSRGRENRLSHWTLPIRMSCEVTLQRDMDERKNKGLWLLLQSSTGQSETGSPH